MAQPNLVILDAPSNLGLRPPAEGIVPGCYKLPWALRDRGLLQTLAATDGGALVPPRYDPAWSPGAGARNAENIAAYSQRLADRIQHLTAQYAKVMVLGGDCSILIGCMLALKRSGRYGLVFLDAHSDFRHPGNSPEIGAAAGEDLAILTGRGDERLIDLEGLQPYVREEDVHLVGVRMNDDALAEIRSAGFGVTTSRELLECGVDAAAEAALRTTGAHASAFWIHFDLDVIDQSEMPAADSPEPDGPSFSVISDLLARLLAAPNCLGMDVTIFDPDLDPDGACADRIVRSLTAAFAGAFNI